MSLEVLGWDENADDRWLVAKIFVRSDSDKDNVIKELIGPIVQELEAQGVLKSFHFLRYADSSGLYIRFRFLVPTKVSDDARHKVENRAKELNSLWSQNDPVITKIDWTEPSATRDLAGRFCETGQIIFARYFEYVSRTILGLLDRPQQESSQYPVRFRMTTELFHFLLNPLGYASFDGDGEVTTHAIAIVERVSTAIQEQIGQGMPQDEALTRLLSSFLEIPNGQLGFKLVCRFERV